jgi:hypothetical protein
MQWMSAESCTHRKIAGSRDTAPCDCLAFGVRGGPALGFAPSTNAGRYFPASAMSSTIGGFEVALGITAGCYAVAGCY